MEWLFSSPINTSTWVALVDAELASLKDNSAAFKLYDVAVKLAVNNDWLLEEGWGLYLQGSHFVRCGVEGLGSELQRRGISRQSQWGAQGIVNHLNSIVGPRSQYPLKRHIFTSDVAVQTESAMMPNNQDPSRYDNTNTDIDDEQETTLRASDLAAILKWSKDISSDINLSSDVLTYSQKPLDLKIRVTPVIIAREAGDYSIATSMTPPDPCQVYESPKSIRTLTDPLQKAIIEHTLNSKENTFFGDASSDLRFSSEAAQSMHRSVICIPISSNRGQTFGAVYVASKYSFSRNVLTSLTLLCQQASISVSNALLFRSVQAGTRENLKMISAQKDALEAARKSREDALKATKIIDSILDYSKLEASAVKLEPSGFLVEDCMELLLPMAAKKLDLSFNIEPNVPPWVYADYARIRQVLMNLIGNAVKFTAQGFVQVTCSVETPITLLQDEVILKFVIKDTGIGLSQSDVELLFVPFQQADNSSTRRFGGTGLGLSISRQLVKLMNGAIAVESELNYLFDIENLKSDLMKPRAPKVLVISSSNVTLTLFSNMLSGFHAVLIPSLSDAESYLQNLDDSTSPLDFIILDDQSETHVDELAKFLQQHKFLLDTKIIHLYTPTTSLSGRSIFGSSTPGVVKMTKPPRKGRLFQTLAGLKNLPNTMSTTPTTDVAKAIDDLAAAQHNPIAQNLLVKQLERYQLNVTATSNGNEALTQWEAHEPGYFSVALFDHHMPICDGVEAAKRLRLLEAKRKSPVMLPIVALSADCQESTKQLCLSAGMNAFFSKPLKKIPFLALEVVLL
ncbi:hypothetical protein D9758_012211 [Tetrapyrgos nigripes]|uniref:Histidine kinase n=1 Tax=Tetrapyrgos nigripes TaxID=182062 RepID=A0A8H5CB25_9AGAR|nr:hypothetical protein D9758_012211 [Tetrapyrgos nigripes]